MTGLDALVSTIVSDDISQAFDNELERLTSTLAPMVEQVQTMKVDIPSDPVALGLSQFNEKLSVIRQYANQVTPMQNRAIALRAQARSRRDQAKKAFEARLNLLLSTDEDVLKEKGGQQAKMAMAKDKLSREGRVVAYCEQLYAVASAYYDAIKLASDNLKDTKSDLMAQLAVIKQQIAIGEVDGKHFPVQGADSGRPHTSPLQRAEAEIAASLPIPEGTIRF
jgi:hypothetical protein